MRVSLTQPAATYVYLPLQKFSDPNAQGLVKYVHLWNDQYLYA